MLARLQIGFRHGHAADKCAVGGAKVFEQHRVIRDGDFTVPGGNRAVIDDEIVLVATPDAIDARFQEDFPRLRGAGIDNQAVAHESNLIAFVYGEPGSMSMKKEDALEVGLLPRDVILSQSGLEGMLFPFFSGQKSVILAGLY